MTQKISTVPMIRLLTHNFFDEELLNFIYDVLHTAFHILKSNFSLFILISAEAKYVIRYYVIVTLACFEDILQNKISGFYARTLHIRLLLYPSQLFARPPFRIMNKKLRT